MLSKGSSASVPSRRQSGGIRLRTHPRCVSKTIGTGWSGGPEHGNVAEALTPRPSAFWLIACGLRSSFRLNYFCIEEENSHLVITYVAVPKMPEHELTWLERLLTLGKAPKLP